MLSRTADHLYWMARYMERAENTARLLDVACRLSLVPHGGEPNQEWSAALTISSLQDAFRKEFSEINAANVLEFMVLSSENSSSIYSCLRAARENARAVRGSITAEMWEDLNTTWLDMAERTKDILQSDSIGRFFEWVKERSHLFRGVTYGTLLRDEAFYFIRLGTFIERSDSTARMLDVKYHILLPDHPEAGGAVDYYQWSSLLNSASAFESYRKVYRDVITPWRVAELLILRCDVPRSLHTCLNEVYELLQTLTTQGSHEAERQAGALHAWLHYGKIEDIFKTGMHDYLTDFLKRVNELSTQINREFLVPS